MMAVFIFTGGSRVRICFLYLVVFFGKLSSVVVVVVRTGLELWSTKNIHGMLITL